MIFEQIGGCLFVGFGVPHHACDPCQNTETLELSHCFSKGTSTTTWHLNRCSHLKSRFFPSPYYDRWPSVAMWGNNLQLQWPTKELTGHLHSLSHILNDDHEMRTCFWDKPHKEWALACQVSGVKWDLDGAHLLDVDTLWTKMGYFKERWQKISKVRVCSFNSWINASLYPHWSVKCSVNPHQPQLLFPEKNHSEGRIILKLRTWHQVDGNRKRIKSAFNFQFKVCS